MRGADMQEAMLTVSDLNRPGLQFQGFYDYFDPHRLQIIGRAEHMYLQGLCSEDRRKCFDDLFLYGIPALIISRELECFPECMDAAKTYGRTVLRSTETTVDFTSHVIEYLNRALAPMLPATAFSWMFTVSACSSWETPASARASWPSTSSCGATA